MFEKSEIYEKVVNIISKHAKNEQALSQMSEETNILSDLQVNSARLVDIVLDFEDAFEIEISDDEADKIATIGDAVSLVSERVKH
jgi:acyl carrier protein